MGTRKVAITGLGLVTPYGEGVEIFWDGLMEGRSAVRPVEGLDLLDMPTTHYGQLPPIDFDAHIDPQRSALWSKPSKLSVLGGILAAKDAGVDRFTPDRTGVILGLGYGCTYDFEDLYLTWHTKGWKRIKPGTVPRLMPNAPASHLAIHLGARGVTFTVSTACSSGAIAAGLATQQIRAGAIDACITGGVDYLINASTCGAWNALRVLSRRNDPTASRPFSADRDGLLLSEGCAVLILEEMEAARARGAPIYAEIAGVGATNDAVNIVGPDPTGEIEAIDMALADAGLAAGEIDYVNAHGTSTTANDANETRVLKQVFGEKKPPVSSIKGHLGHTMGAAGALEIAATALALREQRIPATLHFTPGDEECDLDYVADGPRSAELRHAMTNSFGFGGQNSVLILSRAE
ncbi:MAG: beta-ketoacyl-[acyl-carrier-protein] synthase family protein [Planctomycetota bacterium]